ncbi:MAG TPA: helix-turn-helix transcriptional regulator [Chryseolinea sp.]|nr:helix-turn-helix transcriptional regulator [Chryseolinea sp.]
MEVVEIGQKIKEVFDRRNMKLTEFADELGTVRQNVYRIFKKRHLDTGLLLKISSVLKHNFFQYYVTPGPGSENGNSVPANNDVQEFEKQLELSRKEIVYLRKIIKLMEEKAELVQQLSKEGILQEQE